MQASIDEMVRAVKSCPNYEKEHHQKVVDFAESPKNRAILPYCLIRDSLTIHPVISKHQLSATQVYHAIIKLLQSKPSENKYVTANYGDNFTCRSCQVISPFIPHGGCVSCPVCGMTYEGYISYESPYRDFEGEATRVHWSIVKNEANENVHQTVRQLSSCFPKLQLHDVDQAEEQIANVSKNEKIRNLKIMAAASLILIDNPNLLTERVLHIVKPAEASYFCQRCASGYFDVKSAKYCCAIKSYTPKRPMSEGMMLELRVKKSR